MALQLLVTCSNHQKNDGGYGRGQEVWIDTIDRERRKWALEMAAALLHSDMDMFSADEFDEDEMDLRRDAVREIARQIGFRLSHETL